MNNYFSSQIILLFICLGVFPPPHPISYHSHLSYKWIILNLLHFLNYHHCLSSKINYFHIHYYIFFNWLSVFSYLFLILMFLSIIFNRNLSMLYSKQSSRQKSIDLFIVYWCMVTDWRVKNRRWHLERGWLIKRTDHLG